jgi:hypothetical protein
MVYGAGALGTCATAILRALYPDVDVLVVARFDAQAEMARKLSFVMQRCGFMFSQEVPNDPEGYRYVWHSNHRGRIMLERVRLPEGQDAWLFSRGTLRNLDALVEEARFPQV